MKRTKLSRSPAPSAMITALFALAITGCGGGASPAPTQPPAPVPPPPSPPPPPPPPPPPTSVEREIIPSLTSQAITGSASPHIAINPSPTVAARGRLFVMLPGTIAVPRTYQLIVRTGAPRGYHAIGLNYPNDDAIGSLCAASADPDCHGKARREVITGEDVSPVVSVNAANSITGRLVSLLTYLNNNFPTEGWGQYLASGAPRWELITVAGHSQGGGHAGYLAKLVSLDRAVMISAPADSPVAGATQVPWFSLPNVTPLDRIYGFTHSSDTLATFPVVTTAWNRIGLATLGAAVSVDVASAPYSGSHQLMTNAAPNPNPNGPTAAPTHGAPVADAVTPLDAQGQPLFRPVWIYLGFP